MRRIASGVLFSNWTFSLYKKFLQFLLFIRQITPVFTLRRLFGSSGSVRLGQSLRSFPRLTPPDFWHLQTQKRGKNDIFRFRFCVCLSGAQNLVNTKRYVPYAHREYYY
jgi:hypothetical protein